eukprot:scaffold5903_cov78-Skeletonema_dohrnii-CCMP3373.AAC.1
MPLGLRWGAIMCVSTSGGREAERNYSNRYASQTDNSGKTKIELCMDVEKTLMLMQALHFTAGHLPYSQIRSTHTHLALIKKTRQLMRWLLPRVFFSVSTGFQVPTT